MLTTSGDGLGLANRLSKEGHEIILYSRDIDLSAYNETYTISDNVWKSVKEAKFVIADTPGWTNLQKKLTLYNRPIIGSSESLEIGNIDAYEQYKLFQRLDIPTPETLVFDDAGDIFGGIIDWDAKRTIIRYGSEEIHCDYRDWLPWSLSRVPMGQKVLFQKGTNGISTIVSGWFDGMKWYDSFSIAPDLLNGIYEYSMVSPIESNSRIVQETIIKLTPVLKRLDYHGPVHLHLMIDRMSILATNMHSGFVYPLSYCILEFIQDELGEFLHNIAFSGNFTPRTTKDYVGAVQGKSVGKSVIGAPILGLNAEREKHVVFHHVAKENDSYVIAKNDSCILTSTAHGKTMQDVADRIYMTLNNVLFPDKHYDITLLNSVSRTFSKLQDWRYI